MDLSHSDKQAVCLVQSPVAGVTNANCVYRYLFWISTPTLPRATLKRISTYDVGLFPSELKKFKCLQVQQGC